MTTLKKFFVFWALLAYSFCVLFIALPRQYAVTVYKQEPPAILATTTAVVIPRQIKKTTRVATSSPQVAHYKAIAKTEAENNNLDPKMFMEVINCESNYNPVASHDGGNGQGLTGFWKETFNTYNKKLFNNTLEYSNQEHQIKLMAKVFSLGEQPRHSWTSYTKYKKYGVCFNYQIQKLAKK